MLGLPGKRKITHVFACVCEWVDNQFVRFFEIMALSKKIVILELLFFLS